MRAAIGEAAPEPLMSWTARASGGPAVRTKDV